MYTLYNSAQTSSNSIIGCLREHNNCYCHFIMKNPVGRQKELDRRFQVCFNVVTYYCYIIELQLHESDLEKRKKENFYLL